MTVAKSDQVEPSPNLFGRRAAYLAMLMASPVILVFIYLGKFRQGIGAWICAGLIVGVVRIHWNLRTNLWFWMAIAVAVLLQIPFVVLVPWTGKYQSMFTLLPYGVLDYFVMEWLIKLAERVSQRSVLPPG